MHYKHNVTVNHFLQHEAGLEFSLYCNFEYRILNVFSIINLRLQELKQRHAQALASGNISFDVNPSEAKYCFCMIAFLIRCRFPGSERPFQSYLDSIQFLLSISAVQDIAHESFNGYEYIVASGRDPKNELLLRADWNKNKEAAQILLTIPKVYELAEKEQFYIDRNYRNLDLRSLVRDSHFEINELELSS